MIGRPTNTEVGTLATQLLADQIRAQDQALLRQVDRDTGHHCRAVLGLVGS